jgi:leucyl-tRNA synthetase
VVGVPGHDLRDFEFAKAFNLEVIRVVRSPDGDDTPITRPEQVQEVEGIMINSGFLDGMDIHTATKVIMEHIEKKGWGKKIAHYHLRDWLISRQRYWAPPIPMIFCDACAAAKKGQRRDMPGWYTAPERSLPVRLPFIKDFRPTGTDKSPLAGVAAFYKVRCPGCNAWARRETDVSDTFLDSAWYYLGYLILGNEKSKINLRPELRSRENQKFQLDRNIVKKWLPVDVYIGGAEHSVLHLLYARFLAMAFHDFGMLHFEEPFTRFRAHGLITKDGAKMSKSKGNVITPDEYVRAFGADAMRMYLAFMAPFEQGGDFRDSGIKGLTRFLERAWNLINQKSKIKNQNYKSKIKNEEVQRSIHRTIKKVTEDIENLHYNTAISALMVLLNELEEKREMIGAEDVATFLKLLAPFAPHVAEELWQQERKQASGSSKQGFQSIHHESWPEYDSRLIKEDTVAVVFQVNGRVRDQAVMALGTQEAALEKAALASPKIQIWLKGQTPKKIIVVADRLVNVVV